MGRIDTETIDYPLPFFLLAASRTGSHFFMSLLNSTEHVGRLEEFLHPHRHCFANYSDREVMDVFEEIHTEATAENRSVTGHWGSKVDLYDLHMVERYFNLMQIPLKTAKWIWLKRRDKIKQAISKFKTVQKDVTHLQTYHASETEINDMRNFNPAIEVGELRMQVLEYFMTDSLMEAFAKKHKINPYIIYYEDILCDSSWQSLVKDVFQFLEVPIIEEYEVRTDRIKLSSDNTLERHRSLIEAFHFHGKRWLDVFSD